MCTFTLTNSLTGYQGPVQRALIGGCAASPQASSLVLPRQAGKKAVRAVLWVSADGLRVVDDKTKVTGGVGRQQVVNVHELPESCSRWASGRRQG